MSVHLRKENYELGEFVERFRYLRAANSHWPNYMVAEEMHMTMGALDKALQRARAMGFSMPSLRRAAMTKSDPKSLPQLSPRHRVALDLKDVSVRPGWNREAACRYAGVDDDRFVPDPRIDTKATCVQNVIQEYCVGCPVKAECLTVGLQDPTLIGIWGGLRLPNQIDLVDADKLKAELDERR